MKDEVKNKLMNVVRSVVALGFWGLILGAGIAAEAGTLKALIIFGACAYGYVKLVNWAFKGVKDEEI